MADKLKGITIEIGGDTTKLEQSLKNVNDKSRDLSGELRDVNRLLKLDPGNADLLAQKQDILTEAVDNTKEKLDQLKTAEKQVQAQFERGEVSQEQYRALQREIADTEIRLEGYERAAKETADAVEKLGKSNSEAAETLGKVGSAGLKAVGALAGAAITGLTAAAETTRDYRMEMGKLDTAFTDNGFSSEAATTAYRELVGVLGEYDQSVETANHLAKLTDNEKDLAKWTGDILPGVFATFGDSLPIEGLTEAANETAKVGQVTGPLADALNWAGVSEDAFNESLAKCTTEQERQALITETLSGLYGEASAAYKETNADVIAANQANDAWTASLAGVGAAVEPVITQVKNTGASILTQLLPAIQGILNNLPIVGVVLGGLAAAFVAFKIAALGGLPAVIGSVTAAVTGLNAAMFANPIGLIILAITALVAVFMILWKKCDWFREFWIGLWDKIKETAASVADWFKEVPDKISSGISGAVDKVKTWGEDMKTAAKTAATNTINNVVNTLKNIPGRVKTAIASAVTNVVAWGLSMANAAKTAATNMLNNVSNTLRSIPSKVYSAISGAVAQVRAWGTNMANAARSAASSVISTVVNTLSSLPGQVYSIGTNLVTGLWNGINDKFTWLTNQIKSFATNVKNSLKSFFGINSPSKETAWMGEMLDEGLAKGILDNIDSPVKAARRVSLGVLDSAAGINGATFGRQLQTTFGGSAAPVAGFDNSIGAKLDSILAAIQNGQVLVIDGDALVGATADRFDHRLGQQRLLAARGAV